ncbi:hypothetical protein [Clostridium butyricum]|uniref:hypothetical protein n=1 Tax=Clostridium butyricum TaxID=1492 RepID=UPI002ABE7A1A|nr:hypothetical protein [Clostridium butyricum]
MDLKNIELTSVLNIEKNRKMPKILCIFSSFEGFMNVGAGYEKMPFERNGECLVIEMVL